MTTKNQATVPWTTVACPVAMVEVSDQNYKESLNEAWDLYLRLYRNIIESFTTFKSLSLDES